MPVRIKLPVRQRSRETNVKSSGQPRSSFHRFRNIVAWTTGSFVLLASILFWISYDKYAGLADDKLSRGLFAKGSTLYAAPAIVGIGDSVSVAQLTGRLREAGYAEDSRANAVGWYHIRPQAVEIFPGPEAYGRNESGVIHFENDKISSIIGLSDNSPRTEYTLEPVVLSSLFDKNREKRRLVRYEDLPPLLVHAVISAEDKRFFQHSGFDPLRIVAAVWVDLRQRRQAEGASTLTQQLARMIWLDNQKTFSRKYAELMITLHLERKLSKQQIFEFYSNQVPLGRRGSFAIRGFGEAAQAFFGKSLRQLSLPEAATLAGLIQEPSYRNPVRWPERARKRRNVVLHMMLDNGYITQSQYVDACETPMVTSRQGVETADAPYFIDIINETLTDKFQDRDFQDSGSRIYTTLDPDLQRDATEAIAVGMKDVDSILTKRHKQGAAAEYPQVALICLDPQTGEVKALAGGRNYGLSQLNHALAKRPSGSIFKPFVYAAALNSGLWDHPNPITTSTLFPDEPKTFMYDGKPYEPVDFHHGEWLGDVTLRTALAKSLNVPTVEIAEATGYGTVASLAHKAGLPGIGATPAMALGSYDVTPLEMAGAYTMFANGGSVVKPRFLERISDKTGGKQDWEAHTEATPILDGRVNYLMVNMLQEVLRSGTGAGVRSRGFTLPAAGKTGTSHDAWFAGFTTKLLCVVWIGLDDYQDLKVEGAKAALPVWTEFMRRAHEHRAYRDVLNFTIPEGVVSSQIDPQSGQLATAACPSPKTEYYLVGTQPVQFCPLHQGGNTQLAAWGDSAAPTPSGAFPIVPTQPSANVRPPFPEPASNEVESTGKANDPAIVSTNQPTDQPSVRSGKKAGIFDKLKGIFK